MKIQFLTAVLITLSFQSVTAQQFDLSSEIRSRFEYRNGFKTLVTDDAKAASFVSQRSRLNFTYTSEQLQLFMSLQNVRVWGDVPTLATYDASGNSIHEAWAKAMISPSFSIKVGRQEINYDDQRIFGSVNWVQQARRHDALIATYKPNKKSTLDIGLAMNENAESLFSQDYTVFNSKGFQYLWYHTNLKNLSISFLALNNELVFDDSFETYKIVSNQTIGTRFVYKKQQLTATASGYYQTGGITNFDLKAHAVAASISYKVTSQLNLGLGFEQLSGTDTNNTSNTVNSFNPWFGTNHKFNGWMDYFYVGNHSNSVGLTDIYATLTYKKGKFSAKVIPHLFSAAANIYSGTEKNGCQFRNRNRHNYWLSIGKK